MRYLNTAVQNLADAEDRRQVPVVAHAFSEISEGPGREVACYIRGMHSPTDPFRVSLALTPGTSIGSLSQMIVKELTIAAKETSRD